MSPYWSVILPLQHSHRFDLIFLTYLYKQRTGRSSKNPAWDSFTFFLLLTFTCTRCVCVRARVTYSHIKFHPLLVLLGVAKAQWLKSCSFTLVNLNYSSNWHPLWPVWVIGGIRKGIQPKLHPCTRKVLFSFNIEGVLDIIEGLTFILMSLHLKNIFCG